MFVLSTIAIAVFALHAGPSHPSLAGCAPARVLIGGTVSGSLRSGCPSVVRSGRHAARYRFTAEAGQRIAIEALGRDLDAVLSLTGPSGAIIATGRGGGSAAGAARIPRRKGALVLTEAGSYTVEVASYQDGQTGAFSLSLEGPAGGCTAQFIQAGTPIEGKLESSDCTSLDGPYFTDSYLFYGSAGQQIAITMLSPELDGYLVLLGPSGDVLAEDDDSDGGNNPRIPSIGSKTLPATGTYTIEVSSFNTYETGSYTLVFETNAAPSGNDLLGARGPFRLVAVTPCRLMDTRMEGGKSGAFGPPYITAGTSRTLPVPLSGCDVPANAAGYSLNITAAPRLPLAFLTVYPTGQPKPFASTLNSFDAKVVSNASIVPAGVGGAINLFVTGDTEIIVDLNGYLTR